MTLYIFHDAFIIVMCEHAAILAKMSETRSETGDGVHSFTREVMVRGIWEPPVYW